VRTMPAPLVPQVVLWGFLLPTIYVLASSITNLIFKDALILKVRFWLLASGMEQHRGAAAAPAHAWKTCCGRHGKEASRPF